MQVMILEKREKEMRAGFTVIVVLCMLLSACSSKQASGDTADAPAAAAKKPSLDVELELSGNKATVTVSTDIAISKELYGKERVMGEGHIHMYMDDGEKIVVTDKVAVFKDLSVGTHTLKVSLHHNDHTPYDVTKTVEFEIK